MSKENKQPRTRKASEKRALATPKDEATDADVQAEMTRLEQIERLLQLSGGGSETKHQVKRELPVFHATPEDARQITRCDDGNVMAALKFVIEGVNESIEYGQDDKQDALAAIRAYLLSLAPTTPLESLLNGQALVSHTLACRFAGKALRSSDPVTAGRFAERSARFMEMFTRQIETRQKLRGEVVQQRVVVQHNYLADGSQAVIGGNVQAGGAPTPK